ncbi:MAG: tRNA 4-thiouridine(8) synthase ThiI [Lentisphaeria bacterium]|nr:tRNA 4-thiouridine(8) synthase ThiI [Lentisphaeria bacterium]
MFNHIICRYNEIATKSGNRAMFERRLIDNMRSACSDLETRLRFTRIRGRIVIFRDEDTEFTEAEKAAISERLERCFGLDSFSFCLEGEKSMEAIEEMIRKTVPEMFAPVLEKNGIVQFRTRARRADKSFPVKSKDIEIAVASMVENLMGEGKVKVNLDHPDVSIGIEVREKSSILYYDSAKAAGGLPVGSNAPMLALLSGGIDSPVACHMTMKRGCHVDYLTFHSYPYTPKGTVEKVERLAKMINRYQNPPGILYACNISEIQKLIRDNCDPRYRTVLYRRMMMRIASKLCRDRKLHAVVTGESIGQVASQTVENMSVIEKACDHLIVRPLCGFDKMETIRRAEAIGTFETSIEPMPDSCTVFAPDSPILHAKLKFVEFEESKIPNMEEELQKAYDSMEVYLKK